MTTAARTRSTTTLRDLVALTKPRITLMVIITTAGGIWLAPDEMSWPAILMTLLATAMVVGSANTLNCWVERESDGRMARTKNRPLPAGRLDARV
ncbi:MAG: UbiA family prenyltransferase, partial [Sandaracinaceae bacterium]